MEADNLSKIELPNHTMLKIMPLPRLVSTDMC